MYCLIRVKARQIDKFYRVYYTYNMYASDVRHKCINMYIYTRLSELSFRNVLRARDEERVNNSDNSTAPCSVDGICLSKRILNTNIYYIYIYI